MFNSLLYAGTEELGLSEEGAAGTDAVVEVMQEIRAEVAEATAEIQEQSEVIEEMADQIDAIEEASEEVVEAVEGMESMLKSGNFDSRAFASLYNNASKLSARHLGGAPSKGAPRVGAEDLYDASTTETVARDGMEGLMDKVKGAGAAVLEFIRRIFNGVVAFFTGLFNKVKGLQKKAANVRVSLDKEGAKVKEKIKLGGWNGYVNYGEKGLFEKALALTDAAVATGAYANLLDGEIGLGEFNTAYGALVSTMKSKITEFAATAEKKEGDKSNYIGEFAGLRLVFTSEGKTDSLEDAAKAARSLGLRAVKTEKFATLSKGEVAPKVNNVGALKTALTGVEKHLKSLETAKVDQKFAAAKRDKLVGYINAAGADADASKKVALVKAVASSAATLTKTVNSLAADICGAVIDGIAAHV